MTLGLVLALVFTGGAAQAGPAAAGSGSAMPVADAASEPASVDAALVAGDLSAAREQAEAARKASPSVRTWAAEADVCERQGDLACARAARAEQRALAPEGSPERAAAEARLAALADMSRGTAADEPASTKRAELDAERSARDLVKPPAPKLDQAPVKAPPRERIVKKWYFWVTILAIAASGAAITGIAIKAANDERKDSLDASAGRVRLPLDHGFGIRF
jgi:hypothetical protein